MIQIKIPAAELSPDEITLHILPVAMKATPFVWLTIGPIDIYLTPITAAKMIDELRQLFPDNLGVEPDQPVKGADPT